MSKSVKYGAAIVCSVAAIIGIVKQAPDIRTSEQALEIIGNAEGCRRDAYKCPADVLTVGIGSTEASGEKIDPTRKYSDQEIADRWRKDIKIAESCVIHNVEHRTYGKRPLPQGLFDALVSITFNVGCGKMKQSTMYQKARAGNVVGACDELRKWVYAGGKKLRGLEIRREKERQLCLSK